MKQLLTIILFVIIVSAVAFNNYVKNPYCALIYVPLS